MILWEGSCEVHELIKTEAIITLKMDHPGAKLIAHPECKAVILQMADFIGSTTALLNYTKGILRKNSSSPPKQESFTRCRNHHRIKNSMLSLPMKPVPVMIVLI